MHKQLSGKAALQYVQDTYCLVVFGWFGRFVVIINQFKHSKSILEKLLRTADHSFEISLVWNTKN